MSSLRRYTIIACCNLVFLSGFVAGINATTLPAYRAYVPAAFWVWSAILFGLFFTVLALFTATQEEKT